MGTTLKADPSIIVLGELSLGKNVPENALKLACVPMKKYLENGTKIQNTILATRVTHSPVIPQVRICRKISFHVKHEYLKLATTCQGGQGKRDMTYLFKIDSFTNIKSFNHRKSLQKTICWLFVSPKFLSRHQPHRTVLWHT